MNCAVSVYHQGLEGVDYDATTNTWSDNATVVWSGMARIQPLSNASDANTLSNDSVTRKVQVELDFSGNSVTGSNGAMTDIRPGDYLMVTSSPVDPMLEKFIYIVRDVINSSSPWVRTLVCDVNLEADPDA
jgi:hypothetical protein